MRQNYILLFIITLSLYFTYPSYSQDSDNDTFILTGYVIDEDKNPLISATAAVYDENNNLVKGLVTGSNGSFSFELPSGDYVLRISFVSFKQLENEFSISSEDLNLGEITLESDVKTLEDVEVVAERSSMQMTFEGRTFNVGDDIASQGGSALDVLDNVPSITTDFDGTVSLRGNEGVLILVNGRPSSLVRNGADGLSAIPASLIKDVEVITNPSARYSAEGTAGIINIILYDNVRLGFNGSVSANTGMPDNHEISANLNYQENSINWFGSGSLDYDVRPRNSSIFQQNKVLNNPASFTQSRTSRDYEIDGGMRVGADIFLENEQILTAQFSFDIEDGIDRATVNYNDFDTNGDLIRDLNRFDRTEVGENDYDFRLEYENRFDGRDHRLTVDLNYDFGSENEFGVLREINNQNQTLFQRTENIEDARDFRVQADYRRPIGEGGRFEAGARSTIDWLDNRFLVEEEQSGTFVTLPSFTDNYELYENINAAYAILSGAFGDFSYQTGLRLEHAVIENELSLEGISSNQKYLNLFPSASLSYQLDEQNSVQLNYSRRLSRPRGWDLLPFSNFTDSRNINRGNPQLQPEFSNSYEAGYLRYWESGSILTSVYYRYRTGVSEDIITQEVVNGENATIRFPINLASEKALGIEFTADQNITKTLQVLGSLNFFTSESNGQYENQIFQNSAESMFSRLRLRWRFLENWNAQVFMLYRSPRSSAQGRSQAQTFFNGGLSTRVLDDALTISLNVRDLFDSRSWNQVVEDEFIYSERENQWRTRSVTFSLRYNFGSVR